MGQQNGDTAVWNALAHPIRRQLIQLLQEKPQTTGDLCDHFDVSRFAVMKHLDVLETAGLIDVKREGRHRWNILNTDDLGQHLKQNTTSDDYRPHAPGIVEALGLQGNGADTKIAFGDEDPSPAPITGLAACRVQQEVTLKASPTAVFQALTVDVDEWWSVRVGAGRLVLEPVVGGRFYQDLGSEGQGILYATISHVQQDKVLGMHGPLFTAPECQAGEQLWHVLQLNLRPADDSHASPENDLTKLSISHHYIGQITSGSGENWARTWSELLASLQAHLTRENHTLLETDTRFTKAARTKQADATRD